MSWQWDGYPLGLGLVAEDKLSDFSCTSFVMQHPEREFIICTSYLEIYNEVSVHVCISITRVCVYMYVRVCLCMWALCTHHQLCNSYVSMHTITYNVLHPCRL